MKKEYKLPNMEHKFHVEILGEESKIMWVGDFLYRRPTLKERAMSEVMRARLCGDLLSIDPDIRAFNDAISFLRFTLKEFPDWWKDTDSGSNMYDANVVIEIHNKVMEFEAKWREKVYGGKPEDVKDGAVQGAELASQEQ